MLFDKFKGASITCNDKSMLFKIPLGLNNDIQAYTLIKNDVQKGKNIKIKNKIFLSSSYLESAYAKGYPITKHAKVDTTAIPKEEYKLFI